LRRVVIDASTLLRALTGHPGASSALLLSAVFERTVEAVACACLIAEIRENLRENPYFSARINDEEGRKAIARIERAVTMESDPINPEALLRDRTDDYLVALARTAKAEFIVTGDGDLLEHIGLEPPAVTARNACELLGLIELS
jgi:putative PIN family toxin of toxin-antitoxin system